MGSRAAGRPSSCAASGRPRADLSSGDGRRAGRAIARLRNLNRVREPENLEQSDAPEAGVDLAAQQSGSRGRGEDVVVVVQAGAEGDAGQPGARVAMVVAEVDVPTRRRSISRSARATSRSGSLRGPVRAAWANGDPSSRRRSDGACDGWWPTPAGNLDLPSHRRWRARDEVAASLRTIGARTSGGARPRPRACRGSTSRRRSPGPSG